MIQNNILRKNDKKGCTADELLQDDDFIASQLHPASESAAHFREMIGNGMVAEREFAFARDFILSTRVALATLSDEDMFSMWADIEVINKTKIKKSRLRLRFISMASGMAAVFAVAVLVAGMIRNYSESFSPLFVADDALEAGADVKLYLSEERSLSFGGGEVKIDYNEDGIRVGGNDVVMAENLAAVRSGYHQLVVPKGKRSRLTLSDGSVVWVNAGSRIAFPVAFNKRHRYLYVDGEAYLEVSRDPKRPFVVKTTEINVEVLGTSFSVSSCADKNTQSVVLVNGSVRVSDAGTAMKETILSPNEMYLQSNGITKISKVNADVLVAWKDGLLHYNRQSLGIIVHDLSDYYGLDIVCSPDVYPMKFTGKLELKENLSSLLDGLSKCTPIEYRYENGVYNITTNKVNY